MMNHHRITAIPVWSDTGGIHEYNGFIDMKDVIKFLSNICSPSKVTPLAISTLEDLVREGSCAGAECEVASLLTLAHRHPFLSVTAGSPLIDVVDLMREGVSRVPVMTGGRITNVISQSDIVNLLQYHMHDLEPKTLSKSLEELDLVGCGGEVMMMPVFRFLTL
jgi:CBS domain-containing protein